MKIVIFDVEDRDELPPEFPLEVSVEPMVLEYVKYIVANEQVDWDVNNSLFEVVERSGGIDDIEPDFVDFAEFVGTGIDQRQH